MRRRLFASATAAAVLGGTLALGQVSVNAAPAPAVDSVKVDATPSQVTVMPRAFGPLDVIKAVKGLYDAYQTCVKNQAVDQPCRASDSDNIRAALAQLSTLNNRVKELQRTLDERFRELDLNLRQQTLNEYRRSFVRIDENVPHAIGALSALVDCQAAQLDGQSECARFSLSGTGPLTPVDDGIDYNRQAFLNYTDENRLPSDLTGTIADYAGTSRSEPLSDISFANVMWRFAKLKVEYEADVEDGVFKKSVFAPFVTPSMATEVNTYLQYYGGLLAAYGEVLYARAVVLRDRAIEEGNDRAAKRFQDDADNLRDQIANKIDSPDARSIAGVNALYRLTPLDQGDIIMADDDGVGARVFQTGGRYLPGSRPMSDMDVAALGQGLRLYGKYSSLRKSEPQAFPARDDWYVVRAPIVNKACDARAFGESARGESNVFWLPSVVSSEDKPVIRTNIRVRLLDRPAPLPSIEEGLKRGVWPGPVMRCFDTDGERYGAFAWRYEPYDSIREKDRVWGATEVRFPMTYDWEVHTFLFGVYRDRISYGEGMSVALARAPLDSISIDTSANQLVRWPEGYTPTGMPADYRR